MNKKKLKENLYNQEWITVRGARTHNLKNITVKIPRNKMTVITGLSGSGKSSLAFDTIFAEGQRRYVESLSTYARQFLKQMNKPDVDEITGLSPAISIDQKTRSNNPRSTVATITEIYDYLRILFARVGQPFSPISGTRIRKLSNQEIIDFILNAVTKYDNSKEVKKVMGVAIDEMQIHILTPVVRGRKGEHYQLLYDMLERGYSQARVDGKMYSLRKQIKLTKTKKHDIDFIVDSFSLHEFKDNPDDVRLRLGEAVERAILESEGMIRILVESESGDEIDEFLMSAKLVCPEDGYVFPEIEPRLFSFNSPYGACQECSGLGTKHMFGEEVCAGCLGARLRPEALQVFLGVYDTEGNIKEGEEHRKNIDDFVGMRIEEAYAFMADIDLTEKERKIASVLIREIESRLEFLMSVGLEYLTLNRRAHTLSGGESQRIRLASQLGSQLVGALYVLDEPTIGLHASDNKRLIATLRELADKGNTIIIVEHDEETIRASDYFIEIGPGAGIHGGELIVADDLQKLLVSDKDIKKSITLEYLTGKKEIETPKMRRKGIKELLK